MSNQDNYIQNHEDGSVKDDRTGREILIPNGPVDRTNKQEVIYNKDGSTEYKPFLDDAIFSNKNK